MIVGIDGRSLVGGQAGRGVARYTGALTAALAGPAPGDPADAAVARWDLDPGRVPVVFPGVDRPGAVSPREGRYLLFVGALEPRKAPDVLAGAYRRARERGLDAELVVVGTGRMADV